MDARLAVALDALRPSAFERETRGTIEGSLTPELTFASQRGRVYYEFEGGSFNTPGDWSFISHAIGASYRVDLKEAEKARLFAGGTGSWRRNGDAWSEANYDALTAFVNFELRPREGLTLWTGYRLADRSFDQLSWNTRSGRVKDRRVRSPSSTSVRPSGSRSRTASAVDSDTST